MGEASVNDSTFTENRPVAPGLRLSHDPSRFMNRFPTPLLAVLAAAATLLEPVCASLQAATPTTLVSDLWAPTKTYLTHRQNLLVAEAGRGPNTGRISFVDIITGSRRTMVEGLPSGLAAPNNQPSGPSGLARLGQGRTVYLTIGTGDAVVNGSVAQTTVPNARPSSPLLTSVLSFDFSLPPELITDTITLSPADHATLKSGGRIARGNITIELVADFEDYVADPRPNAPDNVRAANPFGLVALNDRLFVVDASMNSIRTVDLRTRTTGTLTTFAPLPNTRAGVGGSVVEAVPDGIRVYGDKLLVTLLTGFPFPLGGAQVQLVDPATGVTTPFINGLTSAIDVVPLPGDGFLTLEHTADMFAGEAAPPSGRLQWFAAQGAAPVVFERTLRNPTRLEFEEQTGWVFITEVFAGRILKMSPWSTPSASPFTSLSVRGSAGSGSETLIAGFTVETPMKQVLIRGVGARLASFGVTGALADPRITVYDSAGRAVAASDNWGASGDTEVALLNAAMAKVGAFPLAVGSRDAALLRTLPPGAYSVHVSGVGGTAGIALVDVYQVP
jgi:hypothetical protein